MQSFRNAVLSYMRIRVPVKGHFIPEYRTGIRMCSTAVNVDKDQVMDRVIELVKKFNKIDAAKVTEKADFQKDLSLDSLDRVELIMAFEEEFSVEIPDAQADKLKCCADVAKYVISSSSEKVSESS